MIVDIDSDNIKRLKNKGLAGAARLYVDIYRTFLEHIARTGMPVAAERCPSVRENRVKSLKMMGAEALYNGRQIKLNHLSPACGECRTGAESTTFILSLQCNRDCYFCTNRNQENYEVGRLGTADVIQQFDQVLKRNGKMKAAALTGGEPLLFPAECAEFVAHVKKTSPATHTRIYTNGDLATPETLSVLAAAGLDEIRFGIKLDDDFAYDPPILGTIGVAVDLIPRVLVEMPVPPGAAASMRQLMTELDHLGVAGINLLEFLFPWHNPVEYRRRGFAVKAKPYQVLYDYDYAGGLPVDGSEEECLDLIAYAAQSSMTMGVHYCSLENKLTAQRYHQNSKVKLSAVEMFSSTDFFIKTAKAYGEDVALVKRTLSRDPRIHILEDRANNLIEFNPEFIPRLAACQETRDLEIGITYNIVESEGQSRFLRELKINMATPCNFDPRVDL
jgi:pyruvate formate-lyase activating enzyme-like uncharacterized protein